MQDKPITENIFVNAVEYQVKFWYSPEEKSTWDCPGCDEQYDIEEIKRVDTIEQLRAEGFDLEGVEALDEYEQGDDFYEEIIDKLKINRAEYKRDNFREPY